MKKTLTASFIFFLGLSIFSGKAQETILKIGDEKVSSEEFLRVYQKNNGPNAIDPKTMDEYMDLFINYKLKVLEAKSRGMDTLKSFQTELKGYREQLARPYLKDNEATEALIKEAYDRSIFDVHASHILIKIPALATPEDTTELYNKIMQIRNRIVSGGEAFDVVAKGTSEDPSAKYNGGDLGFFNAFQMVYPFENAAYITATGSVSMPFRTRFGYHIVKVWEKRKAKGQVKVAHIMLATPNGTSPEKHKAIKEKIDRIYSDLKKGTDFSYAAKEFSQDRGSAARGGELPWFGTGRMVAEFETAAFDITNKGDISKPVKTKFGWHIIKLIDKKGLSDFETMKSELRSKVERDVRSQKSKDVFFKRLEKEYECKLDTQMVQKFMDIIDGSLFEGSWNYSAKMPNDIFLSYAGIERSLDDLGFYIMKRQRKENPINLWDYLNKRVKEYKEAELMNYEESRLEKKYADFRYLINEYHDGILLFDITDKMVWKKASEDSLGLENFFKKNQENYKYKKHMYAKVYTIKDVSVLPKLEKAVSKGSKVSSLVSKLNRKLVDSLKIEIEEKDWTNENEQYVPVEIEWKKGNMKFFDENGVKKLICITSVKEDEPKALTDCRGMVIADYQEFLEKEWIKTLRGKYTVEVDKKVLQSLQ